MGGMNNQDRLAEIRQRRAAITSPLHEALMATWIGRTGHPVLAEFIAHAPDDIDWLIGEVEQLRGENQQLDYRVLVAGRDIERLRGLLRRLEWEGCNEDITGARPACPACERDEDDPAGHEPDCRLAAEIRST